MAVCPDFTLQMMICGPVAGKPSKVNPCIKEGIIKKPRNLLLFSRFSEAMITNAGVCVWR